MNKIKDLEVSSNDRIMVYRTRDDDGLLVQWSYGRMDWFRVDTKEYIYIERYSYWEPA